MPLSTTQVVLLAALAAAVALVWHREESGRWRAAVSDRLLYGVPVGTLVTVAIVVGFYLFAQSGLWHWHDPVVLAYVTWSYFYPTGTLTAGIAHGSPTHLVSNVTATLALAPIAEYAWGHYAGGRAATDGDEETTTARPGKDEASDDAEDWPDPDESTSRIRGDDGLLANPWVRALVLFPGALLLSALVTSAFGLGPGIGFSGAVYAILGFALLTFPLATVVAVLVSSALGTLYEALTVPIVREVVETGTPSPPSWAGIGFQAHMLGFLLGVVAAVLVLRSRGSRPRYLRVFLATLAVGLVQGLWLIAWPGGDDVYYLYRGAGVVVLVGLATLVAGAAAGSRTTAPRPLSALSGAPSRSAVATAGIVLFALLIAFPSTLLGAGVVDAGPDPEAGSVAVGDYTVFYGEDVSTERASGAGFLPDSIYQGEQSGVLVVSAERELWTTGVQPRVLEHEGNGSVVVGGPGWHETVEAQRHGWVVAGNDTAYAVDLHHDGTETRSFTTDPVTADVRLAGHEVAVVPTADEFELRVAQEETVVQTAPVPETGSSTTVGNLEVTTEETDGEVRIYAETGDSRVPIATEETY